LSARCRAEASKLRKKYARVFDIHIEDVEIEEWPEDEAIIFSPNHPELPRWSTGKCP